MIITDKKPAHVSASSSRESLPPSYSSLRRAAYLAALPSINMGLTGTPESPAAIALVNVLAAMIYLSRNGRQRPSVQYAAALGAIVADLLCALAYDPSRPCYRPMASGSFTGLRVGYHPFRRVIDDLSRAGLVDVHTGDRPFRDNAGIVTRIIPTDALAKYVTANGIDPADRLAHFTYAKPTALTSPIRLKSGSKRGPTWNKIAGKSMPVDMTDPVVESMATMVSEINSFMAEQKFSMAEHVAFFRGFNCGDTDHKWKKGGRLFCYDGGYQVMKRAERPSILINGFPTVEVDISACHLTIAYALLREPLPAAEDIYAVEGLPRDVVKLFANYLLGGGKVPSRWTAFHAERYDENDLKRLGSEFPIRYIAPLILQAHPILLKAVDAGITWADLQHCESNVMVDAIHTLCIKEGICALPIHDSLIVNTLHMDKAIAVLSQAFFDLLGLKPYIKPK